MPFSRPRRRAATLALLAALSPHPCRAVHLDVHVPLTQGCLEYHALLANRLLREASLPARAPGEAGAAPEEVPQPSESVDLFSHHTPHVTLYLADFDLESVEVDDKGGNPIAGALNQTKMDDFLATIASLNFTEILGGWSCPLALSKEQSASGSSSYYTINGAYVMLPVLDTPCLQTLSTTLLRSLQSYVRRPVEVPSWVASLAEPVRSAAIYRSRMYGSPNVLEGFDPHVTVGFDQTQTADDGSDDPSSWRVDAMQRWNDVYERSRSSASCADAVGGIALGRTGEGGTVLAGSRMGYWELDDEVKGDESKNRFATANLRTGPISTQE